MLFRFTERGQLLDVGDSALFDGDEFLPERDIRGIGCVEPQGLLGVETGDAQLLAAILLKGDEAQIAWDIGLTRITSLIGMEYRHYPCPIWSDLKRQPLITLRDMDQSVLGKISRVGVRASYSRVPGQATSDRTGRTSHETAYPSQSIYLSIPPSERPEHSAIFVNNSE